VTAFVLLWVAFAPVLFQNLPRRMLYFTLVYPFLAYWLIWGGTILIPVLALAGFVVGYVAYSRLVDQSFAMGLLGGVLAAVIFWWLSGFITASAGDVLALQEVPTRNIGGFMLNMILGVVCVSLSLPLGIVLALGRQSSMPIIKWICVIFIEFVRGVPLISVLFMASVMFPLFLPEGMTIDKLLRAQVGIIIFTAAYLAEAIRGGLQAIPPGQYEAADALGLTYWKKTGFIILPQALKISIPPIVNQFISMFKDTSLVIIIGLFDLLTTAKTALTDPPWRAFYVEAYLFAAMIYWVFSFFMSRYSQYLERRLETGHRR
jgi:general L-amino acid transport system permease protein